MKIEIYSKYNCPFCTKAKQYLGERNLDFTEIVIDNPDDRNALYDKLGLEGSYRTVPQIFVDGDRIGGYTQLVESGIVEVGNIDFSDDF